MKKNINNISKENISGRKIIELDAIYNIVKKVSLTYSLEDILKDILSTIIRVINCDVCNIFLIDADKNELILTASTDKSKKEDIKNKNISIRIAEDPVIKKVIEENKGILINLPGIEKTGSQSFISVPFSAEKEIL